MSRQHYIDVSVRIKPTETDRSAVNVNNNKVQVGGKQFSYPKAVICGSNQTIAYNAIALITVTNVCVPEKRKIAL